MANNVKSVTSTPDVIRADFTSFIKQINKGLTEVEASQALEDITAKVKQTGKAGSFNIKVTITPAGKGEITQVFVDGEVTKKEPKMDRKQTIFFTTRLNTLVRNNPDQLEDPRLTGEAL